MNTQNGEGNTEIPEVEDFVIEEGDTADVIKEKATAYKTAVDTRNSQLYARTKKAEGFELKEGKWVKADKPTESGKPAEPSSSNADKLTSTDVIAIMNNKVPEDDINDVAEYAAFKKISVAEALKHPLMKTLLADKAEARRVAEGTATGNGRRGSGKLSETTLIENANKGIIPESADDVDRLVAARFAQRKAKK